MERRLLREKQIRPIRRQIAVHLIRRHLMIASDSIFPARIHQDRRPQNIRLQKNFRILNRAIHMRFRGKIHDDIRLLLLKKPIHRLAVADIHPHETEIFAAHHVFQRRQISRVC